MSQRISCRTALLLVFLLGSPACFALDGFPVRVTRNGATIKQETQVVGKVSRDMLLWVFKLSPDERWAFVKVPSSDRVGWLSIGSAANIDVASDQQQRWKEAHGYFRDWQRLIDQNLPNEAAKVAESAAESMLDVLRGEIGSVYPGYPPAATALNQAGVAWLQADQTDNAIRNFKEALRIAEATVGSQHADTSVFRANLAEAYTRTGDSSKAIEGFDLSLPVLEVHSDTLTDVSLESYFVNYGTALATEHRIFDSRLAFGKALRLVTSKHGERSSEVARVASLFAAAMDQAGHRKDSLKQLTRTLEIYREIVDAENPLMIDTLNRLSACSARTGDFNHAERHAAEAVKIQRDMDEPVTFQLASSLNNLGRALTMSGQFDAAEKALNEATELMESVTEKRSFLSSFPRKNLALLAMERGDAETARQGLLDVLKIRTESRPSGDRSLGDVHTLLGELALRENDQQTARTHFSKAVRIQGADVGIDHPDTLKTVAALRRVIGDDSDGMADVDQLLDDARREMRSRVLALLPAEDGLLHAGAARAYRLQRVLARRQKTKPEEQFFALEIIRDNASVRTGDLIAPTLAEGTVVYAFRAQGDQALIKIPGSNKLGWIAQDSVNEIKYGGELRDLLATADQELDEGYREHQEGNSKSAVLKIRRALRTFERELGEDSAPAAAARFTLGGVLAASGDARLAVEECQKAEAALADLLGEEHFETAKARNNLADAFLALGKPSQALQPAIKALQATSAFGEQHRDFQARVAGNVGAALRNLTHYETAKEYFDYALKLSLEANGEDHFGTARCYANLGQLDAELKEYNDAEAAFEKAYRIAERVSGTASADTTQAMVSYGMALVSNQKISEGRTLIEQAARMNLRERGPMDLSTIQSDASRAEIALGVGDTQAARSLLEDVIRRASRRLGPVHPQTLRFRRSLAQAFYADGEYETALREAQAVAAAFQTTLDESNHETIDAIRRVGVYSAALGRLDVARVSFEKALRLATRVLGSEHPDTIRCLLNIGEIALMAKDYVAARPRIEAAIVAMQQNRSHVVSETCRARTMLGFVDVGQADERSALRTFDTAAKDSFRLMSTILPALSEKEQLLFLQNDLREMQNAWLTLPLQRDDIPGLAETAAIWHLNMKASSHELLATQARIARDSGTENAATLEQLQTVREKLARLSLQSVPPDARSSHDESVRQLTEQEATLARSIGHAAAQKTESREWVDVEEFRSQIPQQTVLVNFARIRNANFLYSSERTRWKGDRYVAFVVPAAERGDVVAVDLGLASSIDKRISDVLESTHAESAVNRIATEGEVAATAHVNEQLNGLAAKVLQPLLPYLRDCDEVVLSPDSQLWTIPWAALPVNDHQPAIAKFRIRLAVSGRELLNAHDSERALEASVPLIVADPAFDRNPAVQIAVNDLDPLRLRSARFGATFREAKRLPGTAAEAEAIRDSLEAYSGAAPRMFLQQAATESVVKEARSPFCLVLSTHGFFFPPADQHVGRRNSSNATVIQNPLLRCGLLMAGCHFAEEAVEGEDDGILTGMEIIGSDLRETELVVLSACETGLGDLRSGEGVAGLRQAFQLAGAKSVVASLWQVEDDETARLMNAFFENLAGGMSRSEALRQAQLDRIAARRKRHGAAHPFFWAAFTLTGNN